VTARPVFNGAFDLFSLSLGIEGIVTELLLEATEPSEQIDRSLGRNAAVYEFHPNPYKTMRVWNNCRNRDEIKRNM
jgi:hypothetical protein